MSLSDPIGDMIARINNSQIRNHKILKLPSSKFKIKISEVLKKEGFIIDFKNNEIDKKSFTEVSLKYNSNNESIIKGLNRVSTPGLRNYSKKGEIPMYMGGLAVSVVSTSKGVMTGKKAYKEGLGGEIICYIW